MDTDDLRADQEVAYSVEGAEVHDAAWDAKDMRQMPVEQLASWGRPQGGWNVGC